MCLPPVLTTALIRLKFNDIRSCLPSIMHSFKNYIKKREGRLLTTPISYYAHITFGI